MKRDRAEHPLFHALVVMGSGLSLGCGGVERDASRSGSPPSGGGATSASTDAGDHLTELGGAPSAGGRPSAGGSLSRGGGRPGTGGKANAGGQPGAGAPGAGGSNTVHPMDAGVLCVPAQWDCTDVPLSCMGVGAFGVTGYEMPTGCRCDVTKPGAGSDCPPGWTFACHNATTMNGQMVAVRTPFDCRCIAPTTDCSTACADFSSRECDVVPRTNGGVDVLCGCAWVSLR